MKSPNKKNKSVCIIGGGFYGCYIAKKITENFKNINVELYEKNSNLITEAGKNNQYRLHLGFHYPRSIDTIRQTQEGSKIFIKEFNKFISKPKKNIYLIHKKSLVSFKRYKKIFRKLNVNFKEINVKKLNFLKNVSVYEGGIDTKEQVILLDRLVPYLRKIVKKNCIVKFKNEIKKINSKTGEVFKIGDKPKKYDYIINTTYTNPNLGLKDKYKIKYEIAGMVKIKNNLKNTAVTIMDGPYVSLYPRNSTESSLSSVKFTPIKKFKMLEWKETTHKDWDWFIVNKVNGNVINIINFIEKEKIKQLKLTYDDLINKINSLIETYELPKNKNNELKDIIKESIYNFIHTL